MKKLFASTLFIFKESTISFFRLSILKSTHKASAWWALSGVGLYEPDNGFCENAARLRKANKNKRIDFFITYFRSDLIQVYLPLCRETCIWNKYMYYILIIILPQDLCKNFIAVSYLIARVFSEIIFYQSVDSIYR